MTNTILTPKLCINCTKDGKFQFQKEWFCSNKCVVKTHGRVRMDPSSVLLHTIDAGLDNAITVDFSGCNGKAFEKYERNLSKAILKTSKKTVKPKYTHNEGALPREWR